MLFHHLLRALSTERGQSWKQWSTFSSLGVLTTSILNFIKICGNLALASSLGSFTLVESMSCILYLISAFCTRWHVLWAYHLVLMSFTPPFFLEILYPLLTVPHNKRLQENVRDSSFVLKSRIYFVSMDAHMKIYTYVNGIYGSSLITRYGLCWSKWASSDFYNISDDG